MPKLFIVTPAVYPRLVLNFDLPIFDPLNLEYQNQAKNIPVVLSSFPIKIWGKLDMGFLSYDQTYKHENDNQKGHFF